MIWLVLLGCPGTPTETDSDGDTGSDTDAHTDTDTPVDTGIPCVDDAFEPDSTPDLAGVGAEVSAVICGADVDYWAYTVQADDVLELAVDFDATARDVDVDVLDAEGQDVLATGWSTGPDEVVRFLNPGPDAVDVLARVYAPTGTGPVDYSLSSSAIACVADASEPNNGPDDAAALPASGELTLRGNEDWFEVSLDGGEAVSVEMEVRDAWADLALELRDPDGVIARSATEGRERVLAYNPGPDPRVLHAVVTTQGFPAVGCVPYTLESSPTSPTCVADASEPNDEVSAAVPLGSDLTGVLGEADWFRADVTAGVVTRIEVTGAFTARLSVLDAGEASIAAHNPTELVAPADQSIHLGIEVDPTGVAVCGPYGVELTSRPCDREEDTEPSDPTQPAPLPVDVAYLAPGDEDAFTLAAVGPGATTEVVLAFLGNPDIVDLDLELLDPQGQVVARSIGATDTERITWTNFSAVPVPLVARVFFWGTAAGPCTTEYTIEQRFP